MKDLRTFIEAIYSLEPETVVNALYTLALNTLQYYQSQPTTVTWQHVELAVYVIFIFGDIIKGICNPLQSSQFLSNLGPSKGRLAFCTPPNSQPLPKPTTRSEKQQIDYSQYELTPQGRMMFEMIKSNVISFPHPDSIVPMQVFECAVRYPDFFKVRKECITPILEAIVDSRYWSRFLDALS